MKFKYDTSTDEGKAQVMLEFARTKKPVHCIAKLSTDTWDAVKSPMWNWITMDYNYPLEPKLVPWTLSTVPKVGVLFRFNDMNQTNYYVPNCFTIIGIAFDFDVQVVDWNGLIHNATHSLDGGVTWLPCGTMEGQ